MQAVSMKAYIQAPISYDAMPDASLDIHTPAYTVLPDVVVSRRPFSAGVVVCAVAWVILAGCETPQSQEVAPASDSYYTFQTSTSPEGSGKHYLGREIASVLDSPEVPGWLERPGRVTEELPDRVIQALDLQSSDVIADIGAGTGYFSFRISPHVPDGKVFAVDIQQDMIDRIQQRIDAEGVTNVEPILGTFLDPNLPDESVDVAIIILAYHEFSHPREMLEHIVAAVKPGGCVVLVEYRAEDPTVPIHPLRKMTEAQAIKEMRVVGLHWKETKDILPQQHFLIFEKPPR